MLKNYFLHLKELRKRSVKIIIFFFFSFVMGILMREKILYFICYPIIINSDIYQITTLNIFESFNNIIKISALFALYLSSPYIYFNIYKFINPALNKSFQKIFLFLKILSLALFLLSIFFSIYLILPKTIIFLRSFEFVSISIEKKITLNSYLNFVLYITIAISIMFQFPIILLGLLLSKIVQIKTLRQYNKFIILGSFIISGIIAPPDIISHIVLSIVLIVLYKATIILAKSINKKHKY